MKLYACAGIKAFTYGSKNTMPEESAYTAVRAVAAPQLLPVPLWAALSQVSQELEDQPLFPNCELHLHR